jgi:hypothetical protein
MKQIFFITALLAMVSAGCSSKETVITGTANGKSNLKSFVYTPPLSGTSYEGFRDTVGLDENGNFELKFKIDMFIYYLWQKFGSNFTKICVSSPKKQVSLAW